MGWWDRVTRGRAEREAAELRRELQRERGAGASPISACRPGEVVTVTGTVRALVQRPRDERPQLEVELYDGTGAVRVIWLGRHRIGGIEPGRRMRVTGRVTCPGGEPVIFNPRYELAAA